MKNEMECQYGCSDEFAELCALSTSGELSVEELAKVEEHVADCAQCAALLREYTSLAHVGMATLAASREQEIEPPFGCRETGVEELFNGALHIVHPEEARPKSGAEQHVGARNWKRMRRPALLLATAAGFLVCIRTSYEVGRKTAPSAPSVLPPTAQIQAPPNNTESQLKTELAAAQASLSASNAKSVELEKQIAELSDTKSTLQAQVGDFTKRDDADSVALASAIQQRDSLQRQLNDTSASMTKAHDDLNRIQQDRQGALYRVATLEAQVRELDTQLSHVNNSAVTDEKFLAADRDIRELMGARQLYIADVIDVQNDGERSKPFGRVFYTKGKSLVFYAFDLEKQPGYRETKAFQAWGKPDNTSAKPVNLGIFYLDSEQNRRWVMKSDNPEALAQINAVFVTVEPHGGSHAPTGKPLLEAYLHSLPPNHP